MLYCVQRQLAATLGNTLGRIHPAASLLQLHSGLMAFQYPAAIFLYIPISFSVAKSFDVFLHIFGTLYRRFFSFSFFSFFLLVLKLPIEIRTRTASRELPFKQHRKLCDSSIPKGSGTFSIEKLSSDIASHKKHLTSLFSW